MSAQSKLAVILHADVVGSTALVRKNERAAHEGITSTFGRLVSTLSRHSGLAQEVRGDALVAEFSRPSDAVTAAIEFQKANEAWNQDRLDGEQVHLRIGIAMGEVIVADNTVTGVGVVLAQRLEQLATEGAVVVSAAIREAVSGGLPVTYVDLGDQLLKGFTEPQRAYRVATSAPATVRSIEHVASIESPTADDGSLSGAYGPRVAVLPLRNLSQDSDQEFFSEGLSEEITLALSASRSFPVLASSATLPFKTREMSIHAAGTKLGAQYMLDGSVRRAGNRIRVAVELVNVDTQLQVWSEHYDRTIDDIFAVQDDITTSVVAIVEPEIDEQEMRRVLVAKASNLNSYDLAQRGFWHLNRRTQQDYDASRPLFDESVQGDPRYARAYAGLCQGKYMAGSNMWESLDAAMTEALAFGRAALELDPRDPRALRYHGGSNIVLGNLDEGISTLRRAIAAQPSYATAYSVLAFGLAFNGDFDDAMTAEGTTRRLRPGDRSLHKCMMARAIAAYEVEDYETAEQVSLASLNLADTFWMTHVVHAATLGQLGSADAQVAVKRVRKQFPGLTMQQLSELFPFRDQAHLEHLADGLRRAQLDF